MAKPKPKPPPKPTDAERHARFIEMAREVGASDEPEDFDRAFANVTAAPEKSGSPSSKAARPKKARG